MTYLGGKGGILRSSETSDMTFESLGETFKVDSADMCAGKFLLVAIGGRVDLSSVRRRGRGPPSVQVEIFCI
jgi:hypothetical protein